MILCSSRHCTRKPTRLVDNYCVGLSIVCGICAKSTINYYDRVYLNLPFLAYPEVHKDFWTNQIYEVKNPKEVQIKDREQGPYFVYYKLTSKDKKILKEMVV